MYEIEYLTPIELAERLMAVVMAGSIFTQDGQRAITLEMRDVLDRVIIGH